MVRRAKLGDVFYIKVPNGYKIFQWAYSVPRKGDYIRVFDGLHVTIPDNIEEIVLSPHSYIIAFYASRAYRAGFAHFIKNISVPDIYPFPKYQIRFAMDSNTGKVDRIHVMNADGKRDVWQWFDASNVTELPEEYRGVTLLNSYLTPCWLLYLFDNGFDLMHPERFFFDSDPDIILQKYSYLIEPPPKNK